MCILKFHRRILFRIKVFSVSLLVSTFVESQCADFSCSLSYFLGDFLSSSYSSIFFQFFSLFLDDVDKVISTLFFSCLNSVFTFSQLVQKPSNDLTFYLWILPVCSDYARLIICICCLRTYPHW